jgi:drug/metabolite transporter (DMT)-like permease
MLQTIVAPAVYVLSWSTLPSIDKVALRSMAPSALLMCTFVLSTVTISMGMLSVWLMTQNKWVTYGELRSALSMPIMWVIALATAAGYLSYVVMLKSLDVHRVALMLPMTLVGSLFVSAVFLGERFSKSQCAGMAITLLGLVAFYWNDIRRV